MMKEISEQDLRLLLIAILEHIDKFCQVNNIRYSLAYGTLLGAVRHKGFIPWDDDIDIVMLREDYEKFISIYSAEDKSKFKLYCYGKTPHYPYPFAKVDDSTTLQQEHINGAINMGINIDVFPVDIVPKEERAVDKLMKRIKFLVDLLTIKRVPIKRNRNLIKNMFLFAGQMLLYFLPTSYLIKNIIKTAKKYQGRTTGRRGVLVWGFGKREIVDELNYTNSVLLKFENKEFPAMANWNHILTAWYGNYMELPPKEQQKTHHHFKAYWRV